MLSAIQQFSRRDTSWLELCNAAMLAVWSAVLLLPPPTFTASPSYATMAVWASEFVWALIAAFFSLTGIAGLRRASRNLRATGLLGGVFFWGTVGAAMVASNYASTGGWVYITVANVCAAGYICRWR